MSLSERASSHPGSTASTDADADADVELDGLAPPEGPPRWPSSPTQPAGSHHAYPPPYPRPMGTPTEDEPTIAASPESPHPSDDLGAAATGSGVRVRTAPSITIIAVCFGVGASLFALGLLLLTIVL